MNISELRGNLAQTYQLASKQPRPASIDFPIGVDVETGRIVTMRLADLLAQRLLIQGNSGAGKTTLVKHILNQTSGIPQAIIDQEGEYISYAQFRNMYIGNGIRDAKFAGQEARFTKRSILLDVMQVKSEPKLVSVSEFVETLVDAPKQYWTPLLVVIDEAHIFVPRISNGVIPVKIRKRCTSAIIELMTLGRKRGLSTIVCTPRLSELNPTVRSSPQNYMIGFTMHDVDIHRAAELLAWPVPRATAVLSSLPAGTFVCAGLAFGRNPRIVRVGAS